MQVNGSLQIKCGITPVIVYDPETISKVMYMVNKQQNLECQWYHQVERHLEGDTIVYWIHDLFIPNQEVTQTTVESNGQDIQDMWQQVKKSRPKIKNLKDLGKLMKVTTAWCHSHHRMPVTPSSQDNTQWKEQLELGAKSNPKAIQIMMIINQKEEVFSRVYDPILGLEFEKVSVQIKKSESFDEIDDLMEACFTVPEPTATIKDLKSGGPGHTGQRHYHNHNHGHEQYSSGHHHTAMKLNGHKPQCGCAPCTGIGHVASCPCPPCKKKRNK